MLDWMLVTYFEVKADLHYSSRKDNGTLPVHTSHLKTIWLPLQYVVCLLLPIHSSVYQFKKFKIAWKPQNLKKQRSK